MTQPVLLILPRLSPPANVLWFSHLLPRLLQLPLWSHSNQPRISSGTPQCALPSTSPDSPLFSPSYTPSWSRSDWIWNCAHGGQSCKRIHSAHGQFTHTGLHTNPLGFPVTSGHWACHLRSLPLWLQIQGLSCIFHLLQFALERPVYFITCLLLLQSWQDFANSVAL